MRAKTKITKADFAKLQAIAQGIWTFEFYYHGDVVDLYEEFNSGNRARANDVHAIAGFLDECQKGGNGCLLCGAFFEPDPVYGFLLIRPSTPDCHKTIAAGLCGSCVARADVIQASKRAAAHSLGVDFRELDVREAGNA